MYVCVRVCVFINRLEYADLAADCIQNPGRIYYTHTYTQQDLTKNNECFLQKKLCGPKTETKQKTHKRKISLLIHRRHWQNLLISSFINGNSNTNRSFFGRSIRMAFWCFDSFKSKLSNSFLFLFFFLLHFPSSRVLKFIIIYCL